MSLTEIYPDTGRVSEEYQWRRSQPPVVSSSKASARSGRGVHRLCRPLSRRALRWTTTSAQSFSRHPLLGIVCQTDAVVDMSRFILAKSFFLQCPSSETALTALASLAWPLVALETRPNITNHEPHDTRTIHVQSLAT